MIESIIILISLCLLATSFILYKRNNPAQEILNPFHLVLAICLGLLVLTLNASANDSRVHVAIIDTGVDLSLAGPYMCYDGHMDYTGMGLKDVNGHGTNIAGILAKRLNTKTHCLQILKWYHDSKTMASMDVFSKALERARKFHAKYVNMSLSGPSFNEDELLSITNLLDSGSVITVAAGNNGANLDNFCWVYPACYMIHNPNYVVVGNYRNPSSNTGKFITIENGNDVEGFGIVMSGTSQATAVYLSKRIK